MTVPLLSEFFPYALEDETLSSGGVCRSRDGVAGRQETTKEESMAGTVEEVMTQDPRTVETGDTLVDAARIMREADVGAVVVAEDGRVAGILTDRDIVVRAVADGRDASSTRVGDACSSDVTTLTPDQDIDEAVRLMREHDVRRLPVVQDGRAVGIVSLGDLAQERDPDSALADISAAPANN
jgi:CBS domain-containing protein